MQAYAIIYCNDIGRYQSLLVLGSVMQSIIGIDYEHQPVIGTGKRVPINNCQLTLHKYCNNCPANN
jgi:hypothetical protein